MHAPRFHFDLADATEPAAQQAWQRLRASTPVPTPFTAPAFAEAVARTFDRRLRLAVVHDTADRPAAGALVFERRRGLLRLAAPPPLTPYTPILLAAPVPEADVHARASALDALLDGLARAYPALALDLPPPAPDARPFVWAGYAVRPRYTYAGRLPSPTSLLAGASRNVRRLHAHEAPRYHLREAPDALPALDALVQTVFARQGRRPPVAATARRTLHPALLASGLARVFAAFPANARDPDGVLVMLCEGEAAHHWDGASQPGPAMTLLTLYALGMLYAEGVRHVDLGGANLPSVAEFKRRFGLPLAAGLRVERYRGTGLRALAALRPFL